MTRNFHRHNCHRRRYNRLTLNTLTAAECVRTDYGREKTLQTVRQADTETAL